MARKRPLYGKRIMLAFLIATIIFITGFLVSYLVSYSKSQSISISQEKIRYNLLNFELERELLSFSCEGFNPYRLASELDSMGSILGILEERFGKLDKKVIEQKRFYTMLEVQHFLLVDDYNKRCEGNFPILFFFYSNNKEYADRAEEVRFILSSFKNKNSEAMVYSFDYDLVGSSLISILKDNHNVTEPNTVVINGLDKVVDLDNIRDLEKYFD